MSKPELCHTCKHWKRREAKSGLCENPESPFHQRQQRYVDYCFAYERKEEVSE